MRHPTKTPAGAGMCPLAGSVIVWRTCARHGRGTRDISGGSSTRHDSNWPYSRLRRRRRSAGLRFVFDNGQTPRFLMPETMSGGVGLLDFDGDGWLDVYCVQGGRADRTGPADREGRAGRRRSSLSQPRRRHLRGRDRAIRHRRGSPGGRATAWAWPSATTTTTAIPTSSSPGSDLRALPQPRRRNASRTSRSARAWPAAATTRPRRRLPTSTTTATSTSTSATT